MRGYNQAKGSKVLLEAKINNNTPKGEKEENMQKMTVKEFGERFGIDALQANMVVGFLKNIKAIKVNGKRENEPGQKGRNAVEYAFPAEVSFRVKGKAKAKKGKKVSKVAKVAPVAAETPAPVVTPAPAPATV